MASSKKSATQNGQKFRRSAREELRKDTAVILLIKGLAFLIEQAEEARLGTAMQILSTAREDLVHWAAELDFRETSRERFIYKQLYNTGLFPAAAIMARIGAIEDARMRQTIFDLLHPVE